MRALSRRWQHEMGLQRYSDLGLVCHGLCQNSKAVTVMDSYCTGGLSTYPFLSPSGAFLSPYV